MREYRDWRFTEEYRQMIEEENEGEEEEEEEEEDKESARVPRQPYKNRPDAGMLGIVSGSYNGCGSSHVEADLKRAPARILLLQHVSESMLQTLRGDKGDPPEWGETYSREMRPWTFVVGNVSRHRETTLAVVCRDGAVRRVRKKDWQ